MKRITDKAFQYTPSFATDIRKTFARAKRKAAATKTAPANVRAIIHHARKS